MNIVRIWHINQWHIQRFFGETENLCKIVEGKIYLLTNFRSVLGEGVMPLKGPGQKPRWEPGSKVSESSKDLLLWNHLTSD